MTTKKTEENHSIARTACKAGCCVKCIFRGIWNFILQIGKFIKCLLIFTERVLKIIAIFIIAISAAFLCLIASLYLFNASFDLKSSPEFHKLRDKIAVIYSAGMEKDLQEIATEIKEENQKNN